MLCLALGVCSSGIAQQIKASGEPLAEVLKLIEQKTGYRFYWLDKDVKGIRVSVDTDAKNLDALMKALLEKTGLKFTVYSNRYVFLMKDRRIVSSLPAFVGWTKENGGT